MRPRADPDRGRARRSLNLLVRTLARPYRAASRVVSRLRVVAVAAASAIAPGSASRSPLAGLGGMGSRLVILKERHEEMLRASGGADAVEWLAIDAQVKAVQRTPVDRISPAEVDALMTAMDEWGRRRAR